MNYESLNDETKYVLNKTLEHYNVAKNKQLQNSRIMRNKGFDYGTLVVKKSSTIGDELFGHSKVGTVGVIVGHYDLHGTDGSFLGVERDMYRVYWSENAPYQGENSIGLERYNGEIPEHLKHVTWNDIYMDIYIKGDSHE